MAKLVSSTYGDALFELALEENKLDSLYEEASEMLRLIRENQELAAFLNHPKVTREEKVSFIEQIFRGQISEDLIGFLTIIISKGRQKDMKAIFEYFILRVKKQKKIGLVSVASAIPLTEEQKSQLELRLLTLTDYVEFEMDYTVDLSLIGGMVIRMDDRVVDSSIRTQLENMSKVLLNIQLN